ncbi:MAG TPA: twin-arginine translocase subunit TatC [Actinotalea sp.]|jgi:sec-independent protein translocase protein TatC
MPLREHIRELRNRVLLATAGLVVGAVVGWFVYPALFAALQAPLVDLAKSHDGFVRLNFSGIAGSLDMQIKVSLFAGVILSSPWWMYQLWAFITPGLTRRERWYTLAFLGSGVPLFLCGAGLAWWMLPKAVALLTGFTPANAVNLIDAQGYLSFIMRMVLAFGLAFLLPVLMVGLNMIGIVKARTWWGGWRWAIVVGFVFAAVATPTGDAISMFVLGVPICALYFGAAGLCSLHDRRVARSRAEQGEEIYGEAPA